MFTKSDTKLNSRVKTLPPKSLIFHFLLLQICFGLDFGFTKAVNKMIRAMVKCLTVVMTLTFLFGLVAPLLELSDIASDLWLILAVFQYAFNAYFLYTAKYNFFDFMVSILKVDSDLPERKKEFPGAISLAYNAGMVFFKIFAGVFYYNMTSDNLVYDTKSVPLPAYGIFYMSVDLCSVMFILIYYYIYCCVKFLNNNVLEKRISRKRTIKYYVHLADCYDQIIPLYNRLMSVQLIFEVPKLMASILYILKYIQNDSGVLSCLVEGSFSVHIVIRILVPSVMTELAKGQMERFKLILHKQLLTTEVDNKDIDAQNLLRYVEVRRLNHKVWWFIPIDLQLPLQLFSIIISYLIVLIQFLHLYG